MQAADAPVPLLGAWKLLSFQFESEGGGERRDVYDEHPAGYAVLTETVNGWRSTSYQPGR